ncbi:hypothetical protein C8R46DRAFT_1063687 [Mycena filopes]|nr:hypothetical protein C8R46DRAFT_1063687 [Mycena filopes]
MDVFPLANLPFDITELIVGSIDSRQDLISFAAASTACKERVIPRHTEYHTLRLGRHPRVWAHLAQRPDLARNGDPNWTIYTESERYPTTLVDVAAPPSDTVEEGVANITRALRNMDSLRSFTWVEAWSQNGAYINMPHYFHDVFQVLRTSQSLVRFKMVDSVLWHIAHLQTLCLRQLGWWPQGLKMLLSQSPDLQTLDIRLPVEASILSSCRFSRLRRVNLHFKPLSHRDELVILNFLERHPTIEDLRWYPSPRNDSLKLADGSLPNLKRLITTPALACSILSDPTLPNRAIECISQVSLDESTLAILDTIDTSQLRDFRVWRYPGLDAVNDLAQRLPQLTHLEIPKFGIPTRNDAENDYTIDDYLLTLSRFRSLEYLIDSSIWPALELGGEEKISSLATLCPSLQRLGHFNTEKSEYVDIVLKRSEGRISWTKEMAKREWHD